MVSGSTRRLAQSGNRGMDLPVQLLGRNHDELARPLVKREPCFGHLVIDDYELQPKLCNQLLTAVASDGLNADRLLAAALPCPFLGGHGLRVEQRNDLGNLFLMLP
jgi:hypothetical protein